MKMVLFEVAVKEEDVEEFQKLMEERKINYRNTKFYRITNLDSWLSGKQQGIF